MAEDSKHKMAFTCHLGLYHYISKDAVWVDQCPGNLSTIDVSVVFWARMDICVYISR